MNRKVVTCASLFTLFSSSALGAVCGPSFTYQDGFDSVKLAQVTKKTPLYLESNSTGTCQKTGSCGASGYLVAGDAVAVMNSAGGWACVLYTSKTGRALWFRAMPLSSLRFISTVNSLTGTWKVEDQFLLLRRSGGRLLVRGWTAWPWSSSPDPQVQQRLKEGGPNIGNVDLGAVWKLGQTGVTFQAGSDELDCQLKVRVLGPYLYAADNNQCGGLNATFSGLYRQTSKTVNEKDWQDASSP